MNDVRPRWPKPTPSTTRHRPSRDDVIDGLSQHPKHLPPKYFYDADRIRAVRTDHAAAGILSDAHRAFDPARSRRGDIATVIPDGAALVDSAQVQPPKSACCCTNCASGRLRSRRHFRRFRHVAGRGACAGISRARGPSGRGGLHRAVRTARRAIAGMPKVGFFPGSTIGNFEPHEACALLRSARDILGTGRADGDWRRSRKERPRAV